ncbi:DUF3329 domain-containing protein [Tropicimonas sp. IMCC34043]|uniref:DUF3329 domain-containing protein n=1 Tax=Tropicimonas sp. IMCC34043 TaxID=2248760 RepID=UPI0018E54B6F|nr:DUF3329 domain-containing protein [Tropicimonas sp. IMCC34043]
MFDFSHPFYRPLWIRILIVAVTLGWGLVEILFGEMVWAIIVLAIAGVSIWGLFVTFDPGKPEEPGDDAET